MGFILIWCTRPGFCRTDCNTLVSRYTIAGFFAESRYMATCNGCLSGHLGPDTYDVTVLRAHYLCKHFVIKYGGASSRCKHQHNTPWDAEIPHHDLHI